MGVCAFRSVFGQNFGSSISPVYGCFEPFKVEGPVQDPPVLPYLKTEGKNNYDIKLEVITPDGKEDRDFAFELQIHVLEPASAIGASYANGCNINAANDGRDHFGKSKDSYGSMLELSF